MVDLKGEFAVNKTVERFLRYVRCGSEAHDERLFCLLIEQDLELLGIDFQRQELGSEVVTDGWNILAKIPGKFNTEPFLFVFHLDTVTPGNHIEPYIENGVIKSKGETVLGADGKLAIAIFMELISELMKENKINRPIEVLFTVCQELNCIGSKYANYSSIESNEAIVIDHYVTGEVLLTTPSLVQLTVEIFGQSAHVITETNCGINALKTAVEIVHSMKIGRINDNLNINVADFASLSPKNIIPKYARFDIEIRSFDDAMLQQEISDLRLIVSDITQFYGCKYEIHEATLVLKTDYSTNRDMLDRLAEIYRLSGIEMKLTKSFGILDSVCTNNLGIKTVPLGISIYKTHSVDEYVRLDELDKMQELIRNIILNF